MAVAATAPGTTAAPTVAGAPTVPGAGELRADELGPPEDAFLTGRLGIDHPAGWWPSTSQLKAYDAAGFALVQVRMPPRELLADERAAAEHAAGLREALSLTGLRLVLHAPDDLLAGTREHDRQLSGALTYASVAGSSLVVYHGARIPLAAVGVRARLADEERSLRAALPRAAELGIRLAIENLAPVYANPAHPGYVSHDPAAVARLVRRLDSEQAGMCLDVGHAHIASELAGADLLEFVEPALEHTILFHVHDNLGARSGGRARGGIEPLRLDLHLPPGAGTLPWPAMAPAIVACEAPVQLEVHPPGRPAPGRLAVLTREVFRRAAAVSA